MAIMAGMLPPGVQRARRRRIRQGEPSSSSPSSCLHAAGHGQHDRARLLASSSSASKVRTRSSACEGTLELDGSAREAKERLDHKLRGQREPVATSKRCVSAAAACPLHPRTSRHQSAGGGGGSLQQQQHHHHPRALRREVFPEPPDQGRGGARRRFGWLRVRLVGRRGRPEEEEAREEEECAVCLEDLRAGDAVARLPCAHRFHWSCAAPWVRAASRCPLCRARAHLAAGCSAD